MQKYYLVSKSQSWSFELQPGLNRLGRNPTNDCRVHDGSVSSFHCEVSVSETSLVVRDLQSTNGTFVNDLQITDSELRPGDVLRLGNFDLLLEAPPVTIAIPELSKEEPMVDTKLPDGTAACLHHPAVPAQFHCTKCEHNYCEVCVRHVGLSGSKGMYFCAACDGKCEPLAAAPKKRPQASLLDRLTQTIRIFRK